ncbi:MAG: ABC transporter substrate-binding protein, partial [SAR324 cluster bacterium]|nr:ABC transporter substrate-binding protein [SAR324 cluster bacterium]
AGGESNMDQVGWDVAEGYYSMQFAGVGQDHQVIRDIKKMYADEGKPPPKQMRISVYYNRGVLSAALHARAIQLAVEKHGAANVTGEQVKEGFESIRNFTLGGFLPPLNVTAQDHEGGGWIKIWQTKGGKFVPVTDWIQGYRDVVMARVNAG